METYSKINVTAPIGWFLDYHRAWKGPEHGDYRDDLDSPRFKRKGTFARACAEFESAHEVELRSHYNGSGPTAFGGAKQWPVVTASTAFNENEYELATEYARALAEFTDKWLKERGR